jgi:hypothetical protein
MPYIPKAERERTEWLRRWIALSELVGLVRRSDGCDEENALGQIRRALADGAIQPLHWEPIPPWRPSGVGVRIPELAPPSPDEHWLHVRLKDDRFFDDFERAAYPALLRALREGADERWFGRQAAATAQVGMAYAVAGPSGLRGPLAAPAGRSCARVSAGSQSKGLV